MHTTNCAIRATWRTVSGLLRTALSAITVEDLKREEESTFMWLSDDGRAPAAAAFPVSAGRESEGKS